MFVKHGTSTKSDKESSKIISEVKVDEQNNKIIKESKIIKEDESNKKD